MPSSIASCPQCCQSICETCLHNVSLSFESLTSNNMPPWTLISPASRGIGFALAKRVLQTTNAPVVVTARKDLDKVREELLQDGMINEDRLKVFKLDVLGKSPTHAVHLNT